MLPTVEATPRHVMLDAPFRARSDPFVLSAAPAELDFRRWLAEHTPRGAAVVTVQVPDHGPALHLPRVRPPVVPAQPLLRRGRRGKVAAVHAACLADIHGKSPREIAASGRFSFETDRTARHYIRDGRLTAADLGAWPWAVVGGKTLPRNWWADRLFALELQEWAMAHVRPRRV